MARNAGDTVIVMDGTYDNEGAVAPSYVVTLYYSGTAGNPITFKAQNRGKAILDAMNTSTGDYCNGAAAYINLLNASHIVIEGFVIQRGCDEAIHSNNSAHDIVIRRNELRFIGNRTVTDQIGRDGIYMNSSQYNFTFDGNVFHDIGRTDGQANLHFDHGIYSAASNLTIVNNIFYNMTRGWSLQLADGARNWLVANNTFVGPNANGKEGQIMFWGSNTNITVRNNIFYQPVSAAINQYGASISGAVDHNLIYGANTVMLGGTSGVSVGTNQVGSNPMFVNASALNYALQAGSPAIDSAMDIASNVVDFTGLARPQGASADVGAHEYLGQTQLAISGVTATGVTTNAATISWATNVGGTSYVEYGVGGYTNTTPANTSLLTQHSMVLSNLQPSTLYSYRVASADSAGRLVVSPQFSFTTANVPVTPTTYSLSAASSQMSVARGQSSSQSLTAKLLGGAPATVSFSASSVPSGVTVSFSSSSCLLTCSTTLTVAANSSAPTGQYTMVLRANGPSGLVSTNVALTVYAPQSPGNITSGLVAHWKLNETSGTTANDSASSPHRDNGTVYSGYWWDSSYGRSLWFGGGGSHVSVPDSASLKLKNNLTVSFWIAPYPNSSLDPRVVSKNYDWDVKLNGGSRNPQFTAGGKYAILNYSLALYTWNHVAITFANGTVKGYVNGQPVALLQNTFTGGETLPQWAYGLYLGTDVARSSPLIGALRDVRLYDRALTAGDAAALYAAEK